MINESIKKFEPHIIFGAVSLGMLASIVLVYFVAPTFNLPDKIIIKGFVYSTIIFIIGGLFLLLSNYLSSKDNQVSLDANKFQGLDCIYIEEYRKRLLNYHLSIQKNSRLNLLIGLFIASVTISFVIYFLINDNVSFEKMDQGRVPYYYASRFFAILFVNLLVVFFLRLYKQNLHDIKFFQNELSNIDAKLIALYYAKGEEDKKIGSIWIPRSFGKLRQWKHQSYQSNA